MRSWEPLEVETRGQGKAWQAFKVFRDLGPGRTLKAAAVAFYDRTEEELKGHEYDQVRRWSSRFDWMERARAHDGWLEMHRRAAIEDHLREQAQDHARREAQLQERALKVREAAMSQAEKMLEWPLTTQRMVHEDSEDGETVVYEFKPCGWNKSTAVSLYNMAMNNAPDLSEDLDGAEEDYSEMTEEELEELRRLVGLVRYKRPES